MSDNYYQITPPNTCALLTNDDGSSIVFVEDTSGSKIWPGAGLVNFEEFVTPEEAAARALEINPDYDTSPILGPLSLNAVNVSPSQVSAYEGATVTLHSEYACEGSTVTYKWLNPGGLEIPGAATSELTIGNITPIYDGTYTCQVSASNAKGQTGSAGGSFKVTVFPPFGGSAAE
jgi:hypothetical protein